MRKYYLHNGTENIGPFNLEELKEKKITRDTQIWYEGVDDWIKSSDVEELKSILMVVPPPIKKNSEQPVRKETPKPIVEKKKSSWVKNTIIVIGTIVAIIIVLNIINASNGYSEPQPARELTVAEMEAASPIKYLDAGGNYHQNFLGTKLKIDGFIENKATVTTYKDPVVAVVFYTKTHTEIATERYPIYEFFPPNTKKTFNLKVDNYRNVASIGWKVVEAKVK